jgi:uncharacterized membrane protein
MNLYRTSLYNLSGLLTFLSVLSAGLMAGAFFYATINVVPAFDGVPIDVHLRFRIALMNQNGISMPILMIVSFISTFVLALILFHREKSVAIQFFLASVLALLTFLFTRFGNVPINQVIRAWNPSDLPPGAIDMLERWHLWHIARTVTSLMSFTLTVAPFTFCAFNRKRLAGSQSGDPATT